MRKFGFLTLLAATLALPAFAHAQTTKGSSQETLPITVSAVDDISVGTAPAGITIAAGDSGTSAGALNYATNAASAQARLIAVKYDAATTGLTVTVTPTVSGVGTSAGKVTLSTSDQTLISDIAAGSGSATLAYGVKAAISVPAGNYDKVVTYTLLAP